MCKLIVMWLCLMMACALNTETEEQYGKRRDAAIDSPPPADAPSPGTAGWVSCYTSGAPSAACNLASQFCCWNEIDSPNNGACQNWGTTCLRSWEWCDGNNDCPTEAPVCSARIVEAQYYVGTVFSVECRAALGTGYNGIPDRQMCSGPGDGSCPTGTTCVLGEGSQVMWYGMPPNMYVCN